jgi:ADP-ribose pyrophosphatase YjhB (NUDIX family)
MKPDEVHFCLRCGTPVIQEMRFGRLRAVCPRCDWIYFADPKVAVAALVFRNDEILLVQRANEPFRGLWTLPAGFVDAGEDPVEAVIRECQEETGLQVRVKGLLDLLSGQEHARGAHLLIVYRAEPLAGDLHADDDALQARFFSLEELPPLAFSSTQKLIHRWATTSQF